MEHDEQTAVIEWAAWQCGQYPCLKWLHAIPNGAKLPWRKNDKGKRYSPEANKLKAEGLKAGVSDLFLPWAARGFHGFYIEMKAPGKITEVRPGQKDFMAYAESAGYLCQVHDNAQSAIEAIEWYLS